MGFVALGLASGTQTGLQAALFANVAHGVISALLFFVVGGLKERWGSADLDRCRAALREVTPRLGFALIVGLAASLGLPGLAGFWGEFLSVYAAWSPADGLPLVVLRGARGRGCARHRARRGLRAARRPARLGGGARPSPSSRTAAAPSGPSWPCSGGCGARARRRFPGPCSPSPPTRWRPWWGAARDLARVPGRPHAGARARGRRRRGAGPARRRRRPPPEGAALRSSGRSP